MAIGSPTRFSEAQRETSRSPAVSTGTLSVLSCASVTACSVSSVLASGSGCSTEQLQRKKDRLIETPARMKKRGDRNDGVEKSIVILFVTYFVKKRCNNSRVYANVTLTVTLEL